MSSDPMSSGWYIWKQDTSPDQRSGPYSWEQMLSYARTGYLDPYDQVWHNQWGIWIPASKVPGLWPGQPLHPGPQPPPVMYGPAPYHPGPDSPKAGWWGRWSLAQKLGLIGGAVVVLVLIAVSAAVLGGGNSTSTTNAPDSTAATLTGTDSAATLTGADSTQSLLEQEIPLRVGGSILASEDAFPEGTEIGSALTKMPLLPDDVTPVTRAFSITATAEPTTPVILKLPIPEDAGDPSALTVVRIEADGTTTFLVTAVEDDILVAGTPGFSTFVVVEALPTARGTLIGQPDMLVGSREVFYFDASQTAAYLGAPAWTLRGKASMIYESETCVIIQASTSSGVAHLSYDCVDMSLGRRWYGYKYIRIVDDLDPGTSGTETFAVSVLTKTPLLPEGQQVNITARASGAFKGPLTWTWDFGDGQKGGPATSEEGAVNFELPPKSYEFESDPTIRGVIVKVEDAGGLTARGSLLMRVLEKDKALKVAIDGPQIVKWSDPAAYEAYTARASGGETSAHGYAFLLEPSGQSELEYDVETSTQTFAFDQPGEYQLMVGVLDQGGERYVDAHAILPISVRGGEELSLRILDLPERVEVDEEVAGTVQMRGGVLVGAAKKGGYTLQVDWGDGSPPLREEEVGLALKPTDGTVVPVSHDYEQSGTYLIRMFVFDVTGTMDYVTQEIIIGGDTSGGSSTPSTAAPITTTTSETKGPRWVRMGEPEINPEGLPLEHYGGGSDPYFFPEPRFDGLFVVYEPNATSFTVRDRWKDREYEGWNVAIRCDFDPPQEILLPGKSYKLTAAFSHSGTSKEPTPGETFTYYSPSGVISPVNESLAYYPWSDDFDGTTSKNWTLTVPEGSPGDTLEIQAGLWNAGPCTVIWTYQAE